MQVFVARDRGLTREVCARAVAAGFDAFVVTVDNPVPATMVRMARSGHSLPSAPLPHLSPAQASANVGEAIAGYDASLTFDDLESIQGWCAGRPLVVKGVLRGDDAARCVDAGAAAVVVSNHGGRQVGSCLATAHALEEVVDAVGGRAEVYVDGGIRDAGDIVKALALGARAVLVGRPVLWALAVGGSAGLLDYLDGLRRDLAQIMALCGKTSCSDVAADRSLVRWRRQ
jgi:4-hydroxymandelate oxidase